VNDSSENPSNSNRKNHDQFLVVGLGASAGGIQALKDFFSTVPKDSNIAYVVILHMSPEHESKLAEILQGASPIPVTQVRKRVKVVPDHVYVIPPTQNLAMTDGHLDLTDKISATERRSPVDLFFRTLAETNEDRAVSVILSGTGADGSIGLKRVKEYGGVALAQDPLEAEYKDMPENAIATGMVDYVLPVAEMSARIISYDEHRGAVQLRPTTKAIPQTEEQALIDIFTQLRVRTGHDFSNYKRATILRRIERRIGLREQTDLSAYAHYLREAPQEVQLLMKDLLISVTNFFRDSESFDVLREEIIPRIRSSKSADDMIRIWVPGCATGEEAYSLAMLVSEYMTSEGLPSNLQLFATDLDREAIQIARAGFYKKAELADVSTQRLRRFFTREADGYRVRRELRELILFAPHNVLKDPPFSHVDLVSCRNLLIYLNRTAQTRVLEVLHFSLNPGGYLLLGASESVEGASDFFSVVNKEHHIFRSRPVTNRAFLIPEVKLNPITTPQGIRETGPDGRRAMDRLSFAGLHQQLLEKYAPPSVIVNEEYDVVHLSDGAGKYLKLGGGEPSHNLLQIIRPELRLELRTALYEAINDRKNVEAREVRLNTEQGERFINIIARPVLQEDDPHRGFILVLFEDVSEPQEGLAQDAQRGTEPIAQRLEEELVRLKAQLRSTVEQYEVQHEELRASNEELQAMNEELRSTAEELETSKEELQSVNEELSTVNLELKFKIEELSRANNNFQNLMNSTNIGTIFLDRSLRVRQFTPAACDSFNLISSDIGRPLMDLATKLIHENLLAEMKAVVEQLQTIEHKVKTIDNRTFMIRLSPYRTTDNKIEGLVITLVDVTELSRADELVRKTSKELETANARTQELTDNNETLLSEVYEHASAEESRMRLISQLLNAQEEERKRLARDLHDQLGQQLTSLRLKMESLQGSNDARADSIVDEIKAIVKSLDSDINYLAWELRPLVLDDLGLEVAISDYVSQWSKHFNVAARFQSHGLEEARFSPLAESNLYRIVQEALNNCAKHSKSSMVDVILEKQDGAINLIVEDNGVGFDLEAVEERKQLGLIGIRERAALLGGSVQIESGTGVGTTIFVRVPGGG